MRPADVNAGEWIWRWVDAVAGSKYNRPPMQTTKNQPMRWSTFAVLAVIALVLAARYRLVDLGMRPMHTDEAILGMKFLDFWKTGVFDYDPRDYHGPFLHYLTRAFAWVLRWQEAGMTEGRLRFVIAVAGIGLVVITSFLMDALGRMATVMTMLMMAVSPMMVFYSRYFIMEVPFVLLLALFIVSCWRYSQGRSKLWLLVAGTALGCVHATKETFIINLAAMLCGWIAARVLTDGFEQRGSNTRLSFGAKKGQLSLPWAWVAIVAVVVSMAIFSGGFRHWDDVKESVTTYSNYVKRSGGAGGHEKPWNYYLTLIFWTKQSSVWTEAMIGGLAVLGMLTAFFGDFGRETHRRAFLVFLSVYALAALTAYSIIPYKTPWTILSVQWALTLLAGIGARSFYRALRAKTYRFVAGLALTVGLYHLCSRTMLALYDPIAARHQQDRANLNSPYVYTHTVDNAMSLVGWIKQLQALDPAAFSAQVINQDSGWPLPWYLRKFDTVGYQIAMPEKVTAPVLVVDQALVPAVQAKLGGKPYEADPFILRPGVYVTLMVEKNLWDRLLASKAGGAPKP